MHETWRVGGSFGYVWFVFNGDKVQAFCLVSILVATMSMCVGCQDKNWDKIYFFNFSVFNAINLYV